MTDFDPDAPLDTQEQADAYINWCAESFMALSQATPRTFRTAIRCAHWLLVVSMAQLHLVEEHEDDREAMLEQLAYYSQLARDLERQRERYAVERLIVLRSSLDCWEAVGSWAGFMLAAARCAISALMLIELHPLIDLWELECPDVWALLISGRDFLAEINAEDTEPTFEDFSIRPAEMAIAKFTWQKVNNLTRHWGVPPLSPN